MIREMNCAFLDLDQTVIRTGYRQYIIGRPARLVAKKLGIGEEIAAELLGGKVREVMRERIISGDYLHAFDWDLVIPEASKRLKVEIKEFDALPLLLEAVRSGATSLYPDSVGAIERLKDYHRVCVMTGGLSKYQEAILRELGIEDLFDGVLTTDRLGILKVRPEAFLRALEICNCEGGFHTGDSPSHDVAGAKGAGLPAFLMVREWADLKPIDPLTRVNFTLGRGLLRELMRKDLLYGFIPEEMMIPDALVVELEEVVDLIGVFSNKKD